MEIFPVFWMMQERSETVRSLSLGMFEYLIYSASFNRKMILRQTHLPMPFLRFEEYGKNLK